MSATTTRGLEDVVLTSTAISAIDGTAGRLSYAGYDIHDLAERSSFEEVCFLLLHGELPSASALSAFQERLAAERTPSAEELALVRALPKSGHGMDALRTIVSALGQLDASGLGVQPGAPEHVERIMLRLLARLPALLVAWHRARSGHEPVPPDPALGHAAALLAMLHGRPPTEAEERALDSYMVLLAEHGFNASTFAARVAISAGADVYAALTAAVATLKGALHGGANELAMRAFLEIGAPERAASYVEELLARRERLMGIGHRIYKVEDPRVRHLRHHAHRLAADSGAPWAAVADAVGEVVGAHPHFVRRQLNPNVEFYSAPLLYTLGVPLDLFTATFALSRLAGWSAHIREQLADNRIIRPKAEYSGPAPRPFAPAASRAV